MNNSFFELVYDRLFFESTILRIFKECKVIWALHSVFGILFFSKIEIITSELIQQFNDLTNGYLTCIESSGRNIQRFIRLEYINEKHSIERCFHFVYGTTDNKILLEGEYELSEINRFLFIFIMLRVINILKYNLESNFSMDFNKVFGIIVKCVSSDFKIIQDEK